MWLEQCGINFPLLYLASFYLYGYAQQHGYQTFLFATRDCCHWIRIFQQMFPQLREQCHYFHCSRNMFQAAQKGRHSAFRKYVTGLTGGSDLSKVIYIDIHGTGQNMLSYFESVFGHGRSPACLLLSASCQRYDQLPAICHAPRQLDRLEVLVFSAAGTPIEMLNYDTMGTLQDYVKRQGTYPQPAGIPAGTVGTLPCVHGHLDRPGDSGAQSIPQTDSLSRDSRLDSEAVCHHPVESTHHRGFGGTPGQASLQARHVHLRAPKIIF